MGILDNIKQKPDNQKRVFSLIMAIILTLIIVIIWFSFSDNSTANKLADEGNKLSSISPMQVIKEEFSKAFSNFKEIKEDIEEEVSSTTVEKNIDDGLIIGTSTADFSTSSVETSTTNENIN